MKSNPSREPAVATEYNAPPKSPSGSQTLFRGLDLLDVVAQTGTIGLPALAAQLGLTRSTTHRLATALVERRLLSQAPREGYSLGSKLLELGYLARQQMDLPRLVRPHLERLLQDTEDTVHLGVRRMHQYAQRGVAFDLEENEDRIRCVAAPVRSANGEIVAAISVSGAAQYMDDDRMNSLADYMRNAAETISRELGWNDKRRAGVGR